MILQGVQRHQEILYLEEFTALAAEYPQVTFRAYLSQEQGPLAKDEYKGYVQHAFSELALNPDQDLIYLCGNPSMIDDAFHDLQEKGFGTPQVIREKYISSGKL